MFVVILDFTDLSLHVVMFCHFFVASLGKHECQIAVGRDHIEIIPNISNLQICVAFVNI